MVKFPHDSEEPREHTEVKVVQDIVQDTPDPRKNLSTEAWKVMTQYQCNKWMELSKSARVLINGFGIPKLWKKDSKGVNCSVTLCKGGNRPDK